MSMSLSRISEWPVTTRLVFACVRAQPDEACVRRIAALAHEPVDWDALPGLSNRHGVLPLVRTNLRQAAWSAVPERTRDVLRLRYMANLARSEILARETAHLLGVLEEQGIPAVPLKGAVLACQLYGNVVLRQTGDIDLFIPPHAIEDACRLLEECGYAKRRCLTTR